MSLYQKNENDKINNLLANFKDLIIEHNEKTGSEIPTEYNLKLSPTQKKAFDKFKLGESLLILGAGGCGKSEMVKEFYKSKDLDKNMYITSTTGVSAYSIGGITINSFMGIGTGDAPIDVILKRLRYKMSIKNRIKITDILVIDEVSMMSAELFEKINIICKTLRKSMRPFGGIQIILTGDLSQICPVFNRNMFGEDQEQDKRLIIESDEFNKIFNKKNKNIINLVTNFRQKSDPTFINLLMRIRKGEHTENDISILKSRLHIKPKESEVPIHLVSSNKSANIINVSNLSKIKEPVYNYTSIYTDSGNDKDINDLLVKELKTQFVQKGIETLELKKGARVMLIKNMDVSLGLVNGSIGTIDSFITNENDMKYPVVLFDKISEKQTILPVSWELELNDCKASATQIPLMLAYAVTINKAQGLSLDSAVLDLSECFADGQVFVALSRVRSLEGIYLKSFNPDKIKVNEKMNNFLKDLKL